METFGKKKDGRKVIILNCDEDEVSVAKEGSCVRKLQSQQSDDENLIEDQQLQQ